MQWYAFEFEATADFRNFLGEKKDYDDDRKEAKKMSNDRMKQ